MSVNKKRIRELEAEWLQKTLHEIKGFEGHSQLQVANEIGVTSSSLSQMKRGIAPVSQKVINALVDRYQVNMPDTFLVNEPQPAYSDLVNQNKELSYSLKEVNDILLKNLEDLRLNLTDLRRETKGMQDYVNTLKQMINEKST